jgi:tRNA-Thr(GGU) m(6)t(6)A37 methyltransferase TsaA
MLEPIGIVRSGFSVPEGMPIQAAHSVARGTVEIHRPYVEGLRDLDGFDHLIILYQFHLASREALTVIPFLDDQERGVFATRAPARPNRIGVSVVRLLGVTANRLDIANVDMVTGTPVLDIKPYVPDFDSPVPGRIGWFAGKMERAAAMRADNRMR